MSGHLANPVAQERERAIDRRMDAKRAQRWENLLKTDWGKELLYELLFERCLLVAPSFEALIKDGVCAARHDARNEGIREVGITLMADLQNEFGGALWFGIAQVIAAREADLAQRQAARTSATTEE